jgi:hypothetical protein
VILNVRGSNLRRVIQENVDMVATTLHTDSLRGYIPVGADMLGHESVNHEHGEYVRGNVTTNHIEGYFSQLKRSIDGTYHHVSVEHLSRYLAEFYYSYSTRHMDDSSRMRIVLGRAGGRRLTYRPLIDS